MVLADVDDDEQVFEFAAWLRRNYGSLDIISTATLSKTVESTLCNDNPVIKKPIDHRHVLEHIKQLMAARDRNKAAD